MPTDGFNPDDYVSVTEASEQYKTSRVYWYDMIKAGRIKAYDLPGRRGMWLKKSDIADFWKPREIDVNRDDSSA